MYYFLFFVKSNTIRICAQSYCFRDKRFYKLCIFLKNKYYYYGKEAETLVERSRNDRGRGGQKPAFEDQLCSLLVDSPQKST